MRLGSCWPRTRKDVSKLGYYLEVPVLKGKAHALAEGALMILEGDPRNPFQKFSPDAQWVQAPDYRAEIIPSPPAWEDIPEDKVLIIVVENELFEAAGVAYDEREYAAMMHDSQVERPRKFVLMDKEIALKASGAPA
jgi:hypothetical protein